MIRAIAFVLGLALAGSAAAQERPYVAVAGPERGESVCPGGICQVEALTPVFQRFLEIERGPGGLVHILQLGDSHTAGDRITGKLRADLQARFGSAGRGVLPAGVPYEGYAPMGVQVTATDWSTSPAPLVARDGVPIGVAGLAGILRPTFGPRPVLTLALEPGAAPSSLKLCGREGPVGGDFDITVQGQWIPMLMTQTMNIPDERLTGGMGCLGRLLPDGTTTIELRPHGANAEPYSLMLEARSGVMVSALGVVGSTLRDLAARDDGLARAELAIWRPTLIVLAYGVNEGFDDVLDGRAYETLLREQIGRFRRLRPEAALMILGAPDAVRSGAHGGCSADGQRAPPPSLAMVRDVQRRVAADLGVAFWDWQGRMGGACSSDRLALRDEPYMRGDRVHFTSIGADWIGGLLSADLMAAYEAWKRGGR
ncbi:GDSL-type esterase/lipase family protein [Brevundimonas sp.]|uniref:GDSL-type esterase/lipase family protein n=1 Tax=Brevundimonas sp. TaxID=1871086 RepID=UPI003D1282C0